MPFRRRRRNTAAMKHAATVLLLIAALTTDLAAQCRDILFATDINGAIAAGSKEALRRHVHSGRSVRVAWTISDGGTPIVTHWADAVFLTEFEGELFTQVVEIRRQIPRRGMATINLGPTPQQWTGLLGTDGMLEGAFTTGQEPHRMRVATSWCAVPDCTPSWRLAYQHDTNGQRLAGSKEALFDAVRRGYPIRLTWGMALPERNISVEHAAEPVFTTIANGAEVVAHLPEHIGQQSYWDPKQATFDNPAVMWRGIMTTAGDFDAVFVNRATGDVVRRLPQKARIAWYVLGPDPECVATPSPKLAVEGGVTLRK